MTTIVTTVFAIAIAALCACLWVLGGDVVNKAHANAEMVAEQSYSEQKVLDEYVSKL